MKGSVRRKNGVVLNNSNPITDRKDTLSGRAPSRAHSYCFVHVIITVQEITNSMKKSNAPEGGDLCSRIDSGIIDEYHHEGSALGLAIAMSAIAAMKCNHSERETAGEQTEYHRDF